MTRKTVQVLVSVIAAMVLLLLVLDRSGDDTVPDRAVLLPGFKDQANDAQRISVTRSDGGENVRIDRNRESWVVVERDGYPADVNKLGQLISALANAAVVEEKTSNPGNYAKLGLDDPGEGGSGVLVTVAGQDYSYSVVLGETTRGALRYARIPDEAMSYLISEIPPVPESAGEWLNAAILDIPASRIRRATIAHTDGETIAIEKTDETQTDYTVLAVPEGRELSYATVGNGIAGALADLELDDVRRHVDAPVSTVASFDTWDGMKLSVEIIDEDESAWLAFSAASSNEEAAVESEGATVDERLAGWQYRVAGYKKDLLTRRWNDLLKSND